MIWVGRGIGIPLELEYQVAVSQQVRVLGTELRSLGRARAICVLG